MRLSDAFYSPGGALIIAKIVREDGPSAHLEVLTYSTGDQDHEFVDWLNAHVEAGTFGERDDA